MTSKLFTRSRVDENVTRVMRHAQLFNDLSRREIGQIRIPSGVTTHLFQGHWSTKLNAGLHSENDGDGQFAEDEVEGDPHEGSGRRGTARAYDVSLERMIGGIKFTHGANLFEDAHVQYKGNNGHDTEHHQFGRPTKNIIAAIKRDACVDAHRAFANFRTDVPEDGLW